MQPKSAVFPRFLLSMISGALFFAHSPRGVWRLHNPFDHPYIWARLASRGSELRRFLWTNLRTLKICSIIVASLRLTPHFSYHPLKSAIGYLLINTSIQETQRRVPTSSRHDALNATLSEKVKETRLVPTCMGCSVATLVQLRVSHIPMPTRPRELSGTTIH